MKWIFLLSICTSRFPPPASVKFNNSKQINSQILPTEIYMYIKIWVIQTPFLLARIKITFFKNFISYLQVGMFDRINKETENLNSELCLYNQVKGTCLHIIDVNMDFYNVGNRRCVNNEVSKISIINFSLHSSTYIVSKIKLILNACKYSTFTTEVAGRICLSCTIHLFNMSSLNYQHVTLMKILIKFTKLKAVH